jgi:hypothetical protein
MDSILHYKSAFSPYKKTDRSGYSFTTNYLQMSADLSVFWIFPTNFGFFVGYL